jgi:hypothetical protein
MVSFRENETILDFSWQETVQAVYQKYPNPYNKSARKSDIINRSLDSKNRICSERYSGNNFPVPEIINSTFYTFTGIRFPRLAYSYEYSVLDRENKSLKQFSQNYTMGSFLNFVESIEYTSLSNNQTKMKQEWHVGTDINYYINHWFEGQFLGICTRNAADGINGIKWVADRLNSTSEKFEELEEFKEKLKIFYEENIEKPIEEASEVIKAGSEAIEEKSGEITKKIEELYTETIDEVPKFICDEVPKRVRNFSESKAKVDS